MNRLWILFTLLVLVSCQKDQDEPIVTENTLHYDGPNQSAPNLARGISYPAIKFSADFLAAKNLRGKRIKQIDFHLTQNPQHLKLLIFKWNDLDSSIPGDLLYDQDIDNLQTNAWNSEAIQTNLILPETGIWIAFEINSGDEDLRVIGCDSGPRDDNGDLYGLFGDDNPGWTDFYNFSQQQVNINWNIRAVLE